MLWFFLRRILLFSYFWCAAGDGAKCFVHSQQIGIGESTGSGLLPQSGKRDPGFPFGASWSFFRSGYCGHFSSVTATWLSHSPLLRLFATRRSLKVFITYTGSLLHYLDSIGSMLKTCCLFFSFFMSVYQRPSSPNSLLRQWWWGRTWCPAWDCTNWKRCAPV